MFAALSASIALADDFKTINGKEYKNVTVSRVEADGIVLKGKSGITKLYFAELPKDIQQRFGHDPDKIEAEKAAARAAEQKAKLEAAWKRQKTSDTPHALDATSSNAALEQGSSAAKWAYSEHQDDMGRGTTKTAQVTSSNAVGFGFPYQGETHAVLILRDSPQYGRDVMLSVERGQFVSSYTKNFITVKFDDGELAKFAVSDPENSKTGLLFIRSDDAEFFVSQLRKAKSLKIEADFFQEGPRVFEFDIRGLNW